MSSDKEKEEITSIIGSIFAGIEGDEWISEETEERFVHLLNGITEKRRFRWNMMMRNFKDVEDWETFYLFVLAKRSSYDQQWIGVFLSHAEKEGCNRKYLLGEPSTMRISEIEEFKSELYHNTDRMDVMNQGAITQGPRQSHTYWKKGDVTDCINIFTWLLFICYIYIISICYWCVCFSYFR